MSEIWRFTGPPENWITAIGLGKWALNEHNKALWERDLRPGDLVLFHSTRKSDFSDKAASAIVGFGYVGDGMTTKNELWWVQEVTEHKNYWPYVVPLKEIYLFSETEGIDFTTPIEKKSPSQVQVDIARLIADLTGVFCTSGSEREFTLEECWYADEEIQTGADRNAATTD